jgi:3-phenylpropionate/trans-cinnamate dioxygenase ferredoxin reductase component
VVRGSLQDRDFIAFYVKDGIAAAAVGMNRGRDVRRAMPLIRSRALVDPDQLANDDVDLRTIVGDPAD